MTDPRNKHHDKRVQQEKKHRHSEGNPGAQQSVQPGKKPRKQQQPAQDSGPQLNPDDDQAQGSLI